MSQILVTGEAKIRDIQGPVVANSGVITALDGAASQYVRGDGTLADFPTSTGGGSSVSYYLNSSVSQGTIGGVAYRELSKDPIIGAGTDIPISANGYVANYITDANDPDVTIIPGGNFNCEFYFSVNNNTGNPTTYAELYKYDGTTFTLLGTSAGVPESINQGTTIAPYYFAIPVATAALSVTDRLAIRIYVNVDGRTVTLHTENGHLCQVVTTLSKGMVSLNNLTDQSQYLATGTSGTNFNIVSSGDTHTFNLPVASATNTGKLSNTDWSTFNGKVPYTGAIASVDLGIYSLDASELFTNGNGIYIKKNVSGIANSVDYVALSSSTYKLNVAEASSATNAKIFNFDFSTLSDTTLSVNNTRTYTLPNLSGTLALLEGTQTFTGSKTFDAAISANYGIALLNGAIPPLTSIYYAALSGNSTGLSITYRTGGGTNYTNNLNFPANNNSYLFPSTSGTLALTSNLSDYLPLTGGTLTGGLSGTTATFSGLGTFYQLTMTGATAGRIFYAQTGGVVSQSGNLNWNETNGMLGVGTPNPSAVITAFSNNAATQFKASGNAPAFTFSESLTTSTRACVFGLATAANQFITGTAAGDMAIANQSTVAGAIVFGTGTAEKMRMSAAGNFGIGTSSPSTLLHISGAGTGQMLRIQNTSTVSGDQGPLIQFISANQVGGQGFESGYIQSIWTGEGNAFSMRFATKVADGGQTERMRITSGGVVNVLNDLGVGTSSPSGKIHAVGINTSGSNNVLYLENAVATIMFQVRNDGNIRVNSTVYNSTTAGSTRTIFVGDGGYFLGGISSIRASKDNIQNIENVNWIYQLNPVTFNYRKKDDEGNYTNETFDESNYGLIAEDTQPIADFLINYNDKEDGTKEMVGIEYSRLITPMLKAIQEQQAQIEELKQLIAAK